MSNSSATASIATGRSDRAQKQSANYIRQSRPVNFDALLHELDEFYGMSGTEGPITAICDMLNFSLEHDLCDDYRQNLVYEATHLIRLLLKVQSIIHA